MLGILGGTFDPIHYGHLRPAREAQQQLALEQVRLVVSANPPHRSPPLASATDRLRMVELALSEFEDFVADDRELRRGGPSYTVLTLESLRAEIGDHPLCLLLGVDAFVGLPSWYRWTEILNLAHLVVLARPDAPSLVEAQAAAWAHARMVQEASQLRDRSGGSVLFMAVAPQQISATRLREAMARGVQPSPAELPPAVWDYIRQHDLYRSRQ
jgi:nicotinate-nucleotide adenylyltransferase